MIARGEYAVYNGTGEVIPPGAAVEPTGQIDADGRIVVRKPTADSILSVLINKLAKIDAGGVGLAASPYPACTFAVHASDTPGDRASVGTKAGDWYLRTGQKGFVCIGGFDVHRVMNAVPDPVAGANDTNLFGGVTFSFLQTSNTASFPSGYTRSTALSGTNLPTVTDTVRINLPANMTATAGRFASVHLVAKANLFVGPVAGATYGHFVLTASPGTVFGGSLANDVLTIDYPRRVATGDVASYAAAVCPFDWRFFTTTTQNFLEVTVTYQVAFFSNVAWGGATAPPIILRACTGGSALVNMSLANGDWIGAGFRGNAGIAACPAASTI
jgi:hypothetical protein